MLLKDEVLQKLSTVKLDATLLGFRKIGIFGSVSQNRHSSISDIDIVVISDNDLKSMGFEYLERLEVLKEKLYKLFKRPIDIYDLNRKKETEVSKNIEKEAIFV